MVVLVHDTEEREEARRLGAELERRGFATVLAGPADAQDLSGERERLAGVLILPKAGRAPLPLPFPLDLSQIRVRAESGSWQPPLHELVEILLPAAQLQARLADLRAAGTELIDDLASDPFDQPWDRRSQELSDILGDIVELRRRLELRGSPPVGVATSSFLSRFEALDRWHLDFETLDWTELVRARRLLVHELRNDIAVLHLVIDREECKTEPQGEAPEIRAAFDRLRSFLALAGRQEPGEP